MTKRDKTRQKIFSDPPAKDLSYDEAINYLKALGADLDEGRSGSAVMLECEGRTLGFHKPHGRVENSLPKYVVLLIREFITVIEDGRENNK